MCAGMRITDEHREIAEDIAAELVNGQPLPVQINVMETIAKALAERDQVIIQKCYDACFGDHLFKYKEGVNHWSTNDVMFAQQRVRTNIARAISALGEEKNGTN